MKCFFKNTLLATFTSLFLFSSLSAHSDLKQESTTNQRRALDLINFIEMTFETAYAPYLFKKERFNWEIQVAAEIARQAVLNSPKIETKEARRLIRCLLASCNDYHVGVLFTSTELSTLPFDIYKADGKYYFIGIRRQLDPQFPFNPGDEILSLNHKPIDECIEEIKRACYRSNNPLSDQRLAEKTLTLRLGKYADPIESGPVVICGIKQGTNKAIHYRTSWLTLPEKIHDRPHKSPKASTINQIWLASASDDSEQTTKNQKKLLFKDMSGFYTHHHLSEEELNTLASSPSENPSDNLNQLNTYFSEEGFLPPLSNHISWTSNYEEIKAYIFTLENGKSIGYLRLPSFLMERNATLTFAKVIRHLERNTDALIIDQNNNGGGFLFEAYSIASMFIPRPFLAPKHQIALDSRSIYYIYLELVELSEMHITTDEQAQRFFGEKHLFGIPITVQFFNNYVKYHHFLYKEWEQGRDLTNPTSLFGIDFIDPSPYASYSKPVILLINELCMSCGDLFPALMQENKRALLFGAKTQGAGGAVEETSARNSLGVHSIRLTTTLIHRSGTHEGKYIENEGISPDVEYYVTEEDIQNNFSGYVRELKKLLNEITNDTEENQADDDLQDKRTKTL